jgi:hypothetical protein
VAGSKDRKNTTLEAEFDRAVLALNLRVREELRAGWLRNVGVPDPPRHRKSRRGRSSRLKDQPTETRPEDKR